MKNVFVALLIATGAVACADNRPAQDPTTTSATTTKAVTTQDPPSAPTTSTAATTATTGKVDPSSSPVKSETGGTSTSTTAGTTSSMAASDPSNNAPILGSARSTAANDSSGTAAGSKGANKLTPMDQGGGKADRDITAAIRRDVVGDKAISFTGHNVKIITKDGHVTLRGEVKTDAEKASIDAKARSAAGVLDVDNQLEVKK